MIQSLGLVGVGLVSIASYAQAPNPVYPDDAPLAVETFPRITALVKDQNLSQAVRELQTLLDEQPQRVVPRDNDPDAFVSLRERIHAEILATPALLERYRTMQGPVADELLAQDKLETLETSYLLTRAGFEAALRVAQSHLEASRFWSAYRVLAALESHPDRAGPDAKRAAELLALVAQYLADPAPRALADRWATQLNLTLPAPQPIDRPEALAAPVYSALASFPALQADPPPPTPLWSGSLWSVPPGPGDPPSERPDPQAGSWIVPTVSGDTIYVNDGVSITARDRFTLRAKWSAKPKHADGFAGDDQRGFTGRAFGPEVFDSMSVTLAGRVVIATTGLVSGSERRGDPRTHALDATTGRILWSTDLGRAHPALDGGIVRGPAVIEGDLAILQVRRPLQQRLSAFYVAALGLNDGIVRWVRLIASSGVEPGDAMGQRHMADPPLLHQGVVYVQDIMGVVAAVDAGSGRTLWLRRFPLSDGARRRPDLPWEWGGLVASDHGVHVLTAARDTLLTLDALTGRILASRSTDTLDASAYLLRAGPWLVVVGGNRLSILPANSVGAGPVNLSPPLDRDQVRGRLVVVGERVLAPTSTGVAIVDPSRPTDAPASVPLASVGTTLPLPDQWLTLASGELKSHLSFESASTLLEARIVASPLDPEPAITLVEMAYRASRHDVLVRAADSAIAAIDRLGTSPLASEPRGRLYAALREMSERSLISDRPTPRASDTAEPATPLDSSTLEQTITRMGRLASSHEERAAHALAQGGLRERMERPADAVAAYQRLLSDAGMARAPWRVQGVSARADAEATRRIRAVVRRAGLQAYAGPEAEAKALAASLPASPDASALEALARRFPAATISIDWWRRAAEANRSQPTQSIAQLDQALSLAELLSDLSAWTDPSQDPLGLIAGTLIQRLDSAAQPFAAAQLVDRLRSTRPNLPVRDDRGPLSLDQLSATLAARLAAAARLPRVGPRLQPDVQVLSGWTIMHPLSLASRSLEFVVLENRAMGQVGLWSLAASQGQRDEAEGVGPLHLRQLWTRSFRPGSGPVLVATNPTSVTLAWTVENQGFAIERIDAITGQSRFMTQPSGAALQEVTLAHEGGGAGDANPDAPIAPRPGNMRLAVNEQAIVMVENSGRAIAFASDDGRVLWKIASPARWVVDFAADASIIAIAGVSKGDDAAPARNSNPVIALHDARTGQLIGTIDRPLGGIRWMQLAHLGTAHYLVAGCDQGVQAFTLAGPGAAGSDQPERWSLKRADDIAAAETLDAWINDDLVYLLDMNRAVWRVKLESGEIAGRRLETFERLLGDGTIIHTPLEGRRAAFSTSMGVCVFDHEGTLIGLDGLGAEDLLPPLPATDRFVAVNAAPRNLADGRTGHEVFMLEATNCLLREEPQVLILPDRPQRAVLLDGRLVVSAGGATFIYAAPATPGGN